MGFLDIFAREAACPACGTQRARKVLWMVRCPNHLCVRFDAVHKDELALQDMHEAQTNQQRPAKPTAHGGDFEPDRHRLEIDYTNHAGERKSFVGDARTLRCRGRHVSLRVSPTGRRIALDPERIDNRDEIERALRDYPEPAPTERQILAYHARHDSSSSRARELRTKYPHWDPRVVGGR